MDVSENRGTPKSSISIGFSILNHPFWGTPIYGNTHIEGQQRTERRAQLQAKLTTLTTFGARLSTQLKPIFCSQGTCFQLKVHIFLVL